MMGVILRRSFGTLALLIGLGIAGWFVYNQFWPQAEFQKSYRSPAQLIIPIACLIVGWQWLRYEGKGIEEVTPPDLKCAELEEATKIARDTLPYFLEQVGKNVDDAYIKFPLKTPQGITEHIWAYVHFFKDDHFNVSLANEPYDNEQDATGRRDVPLSEVEDWQIMLPDGTIKGAQSILAMFRYYENKGSKLSPKMKKQRAVLVGV